MLLSDACDSILEPIDPIIASIVSEIGAPGKRVVSVRVSVWSNTGRAFEPQLPAQALLPPDREANVVVLPVFWRFDYPWPHKNLVLPLLVYVDLAATGRRSEPGGSALDL